MSKTCVAITNRAYNKLVEWNHSMNIVPVEEAYRTKDGDWMIPLSSETRDRLMAKVFNGESVSDAIERLIDTASWRRN